MTEKYKLKRKKDYLLKSNICWDEIIDHLILDCYSKKNSFQQIIGDELTIFTVGFSVGPRSGQ